jgi:hypothetical protein
VVDTVTVTALLPEPSGAGFGDTAQVASDGAPLQVNETEPANPPSGLRLKA